MDKIPTDLNLVVAEKLNEAGVSITRELVKLVIDHYIASKRQFMLNGEKIIEIDIGVSQIKTKKLSPIYKPKYPYTVVMQTDLDGKFKEQLMNKMVKETNTNAEA